MATVARESARLLVYSPNELEVPGVVLHHGGNRCVIGEPSFAREAGVAVPAIDMVLPLLRGLDRALRAAK